MERDRIFPARLVAANLGARRGREARYNASMPHALAAAVALLTGIAGWHYLFFSKAAARLAEVEDRALHRMRLWLRRAGGVTMLALALMLYAGAYVVDDKTQKQAFLVVWLGVVALLGLLILLALIDLRLTWKIRHRRRDVRADKP